MTQFEKLTETPEKLVEFLEKNMSCMACPVYEECTLDVTKSHNESCCSKMLSRWLEREV